MAHARILVVEDDEAIRETIAELLEGEGYGVARAADGAEALEQLQSTGGADLILLDLMMPVMDGWELRDRLRSDPRLARIPVVLVSADDALERQARRMGVQGWLAKPFDIEHLLGTVNRLC
jgi:CheY-like chemotaxis protein